MSIDNKKINRGLTSAEVAQKRELYGNNVLTPPVKVSLWKLYLEKYQDPMIQILLVAALISLILAVVENQYLETVGIFVAIFFATTVGFYFECDASKKFELLNSISEEQPVKVRRDGKVIEVPRCDVVVGDVVLLEIGDEVPADGKLLDSLNLQIDESALTGESLATKHTIACDVPTESGSEAYPANVVLRSTMVMNGRGEMVVEAVGDKTEIGHVAKHSAEDTNVKTPLGIQLEKLGKKISTFGLSLSVLAGVAFFVHDAIANGDNYHGVLAWTELVLKYFMMSVTLIVMAVPEGLPMAITLALALNMRRMLKSNNLVRKLHACETMGAVNIICTDKTGTLTQNQMTVADVSLYSGDESLFARCVSLNTTAHVNDDGESIGNPTETALLRWILGKDYDYHTLRRGDRIVSQVPFSTELKYMSTTAVIDGKETLLVKGAPEVVMAMCAIDTEQKQHVEQRLGEYQDKAMRTLAFSVDGVLQAIVAISDPVREDVPAAVEICQKAGINIKIVTGDTSATAIEIARQIGIWKADANNGTHHITGAEFSRLTDEEARERVADLRVMSRARPSDKQRLVQMLQQRGNVVAVTGDGTNDAPALNYAHVGLSLGSGTSVAKQASDMTLIDDSFASIAHAVMWGRSLYRNIQRFLFFQLTVNVAALLLVIGGSVIGTEMPLTVTQILWVNLIMDTFAAMALASLPPQKDVMDRKPRSQTDFIISRSIIRNIVAWGVLFFIIMFVMLIYCERNGVVDVHELTIFFTAFVMLQFWNLFNAKALDSTESALKGVGTKSGFGFVLLMILLGQILIVTFGGEMFRTVPLSPIEWFAIIAATSLVMIIPEIIRCLAGRGE